MTLTSGKHLLFDALRPHLPPSACFTGHKVGSFYVKADFSPDGNYIVSGSSDANVHIWQVSAGGECRHGRA